jgi:hypothetical protein
MRQQQVSAAGEVGGRGTCTDKWKNAKTEREKERERERLSLIGFTPRVGRDYKSCLFLALFVQRQTKGDTINRDRVN